jgi:hypothetical protein
MPNTLRTFRHFFGCCFSAVHWGFFFCVFSLYVVDAVSRQPQDCKKGQLLFANATFLNACFGVVYGFFCTCPAWSHVETAAVWMWRHVSTAFSST